MLPTSVCHHPGISQDLLVGAAADRMWCDLLACDIAEEVTMALADDGVVSLLTQRLRQIISLWLGQTRSDRSDPHTLLQLGGRFVTPIWYP